MLIADKYMLYFKYDKISQNFSNFLVSVKKITFEKFFFSMTHKETNASVISVMTLT